MIGPWISLEKIDTMQSNFICTTRTDLIHCHDLIWCIAINEEVTPETSVISMVSKREWNWSLGQNILVAWGYLLCLKPNAWRHLLISHSNIQKAVHIQAGYSLQCFNSTEDNMLMCKIKSQFSLTVSGSRATKMTLARNKWTMCVLPQ